MKNAEWQIIAANKDPIEWFGDLSDDCSARWAGLLLRAEEMDDNEWWWAVTDLKRGLEVDSSNGKEEIPSDGKKARAEAEKAANNYFGIK